MWSAATYATTGIAIAGIGATYYALAKTDNEPMDSKDVLQGVRALAGFSNADHNFEPDLELRNSENYSAYYSHPSGSRGQGRLFTASQSFLKAELEALANANKSTHGLNAFVDEPIAPQDEATKNSNLDISRSRVVRRAETDPAIYPPGGIRSTNSLDCSQELGMGSQSENFGYIWRKVPLPQKEPEPPAEIFEPRSRSSHSAFEVETCSEIFNYSSEEGTAPGESGPKPQPEPEHDSRNLPTMTSSTYEIALKKLEEARQIRNRKQKSLNSPLTSSRSADFARRRVALAPGRRPRIPKPSNPHLCLKSVTNTTRGMLLNTNTRPNPYLTRAEPILCYLEDSRAHFKEPKSSSTTEKFQRDVKIRRHNAFAVRRCEASAPATSVFSNESEPDQLPIVNNSDAQEQAQTQKQDMGRDSIEFLFPAPVSKDEQSNHSVFVNNGFGDLEPEDDEDENENYEEASENEEYNAYSEEQMSHAEVDNLGDNVEELVLAGPIQSSSLFDIDLGVNRSCQTTPTPSEIELRKKEGPYVLAKYGGLRVVLEESGNSGGLERRNSGIVYGIPKDSWIMLPVRILPTSMIPLGLFLYIPLLLILIGILICVCHSFLGTILGSPSDLDLESVLPKSSSKYLGKS